MPATRRRPPETYLPRESDRGRLIDLVTALRDRGSEVAPLSALVTASGTRLELPADVAEVLEEIVHHLAEGQGVTVVPHHQLLTTQEAADMLNISRPTFVKLLEEGALPFDMRGRHRRVRLGDVVAYQDSLQQQRSDALRQMQADGQADDVYAQLDTPPVTTR